MILQLYLSRRWLRQLVIVGGAFLAILFLIDLVEQIRRFGDEGIGLAGTSALAALNIASSYYSILPLVVGPAEPIGRPGGAGQGPTKYIACPFRSTGNFSPFSTPPPEVSIRVALPNWSSRWARMK